MLPPGIPATLQASHTLLHGALCFPCFGARAGGLIVLLTGPRQPREPCHCSHSCHLCLMPRASHAHMQIPAMHSPVLNESGPIKTITRWAFPLEGLTLLPGLGPFTMQVCGLTGQHACLRNCMRIGAMGEHAC